MRVRWAVSKFGKWHAFVFFEGVETLRSICTSVFKTPPEDRLRDAPETPGVEDICRGCKGGVMAYRKRYRKIK